MKLLFPALSFAAVLLLSSAVPYNANAAVLTSLSMSKPLGTDFPVSEGTTIVFTGKLIRADNLQGIPDAGVKIVKQVSFGQERLLATGQTTAEGTFSIPWVVDIERLIEQAGGSYGTQTSQGRENRFQVVVVARYAGDDTHAKAVSNAQSFEVMLNALAVKVAAQPLYLANESATLKVTIVDANGNPLDPDEMTVLFDNKPVTLTKQSAGTYTYSIASLSAGAHQFSVRVSKVGYTTDDEMLTIEAAKRKTVLQITTDKSSYEAGETVTILASIVEMGTNNAVVSKSVDIAVTSPVLTVQSLALTGGKASFTLKKLDPAGSWLVSANFAGDESYLGSRTTTTFEVTRPAPGKTPVTPKPVAPVVLSQPAVLDQIGNQLDSVSIGQQVMLQTKVTSNIKEKSDIVYISQVKDAEGITVALSWVTAALSPGQAFDLAVSWTPETVGDYTVEVFVWKSIKDPQPLSLEPKTLTVTVT